MTTPSSRQSTGAIVVGGGPGGMFCALLLARQGIEVTLLESHHDFDRDFRGDTIHPSTLELLDTLGLARDLHQLPHTKLHQMSLTANNVRYTVADFGRLTTKFPYIMLMAQSRFLDFLAEHARSYPNLHILLGAQVSDILRDDERITGVVYHRNNATHELRAPLTIGADGRFSKLRKLAGLEPIRTSPPMDVVWIRLPRHDTDAHDFGFMIGHGRMCVLLEREDHWQLGYVIPKGGYQHLRTTGIEALQRELAAIVPWLADRVHVLTDWQQATLLAVESSRLSRWHVPGLLLIGDAAHVMSPVGGVGISYAIQDAIAASNLLAEPLRMAQVDSRHLATVQARREWPTRVIQFFQRQIQKRIVAVAFEAGKPFTPPLPLRVFPRLPLFNQLIPRLIAFGVQRERPRATRYG